LNDFLYPDFPYTANLIYELRILIFGKQKGDGNFWRKKSLTCTSAKTSKKELPRLLRREFFQESILSAVLVELALEEILRERVVEVAAE